jgi:hypothetical protein
MNTIGDLLKRDLRKKIVEIIQVDDVAEEAVHDELVEYIATERIKEQYRTLLSAMAQAPAEPHTDIGVWVSGFFGSGKSSFAKNLGYALGDRVVQKQRASELFCRQVDDPTVTELVEYLNTRVPMEVIMFDISKASEVRLQNEKIAEVVYRALLSQYGYALDFDVAELEIDLEGVGRLPEFIALCPEVNGGLAWELAREGARKLNYASAILHRMDPRVFPQADSWSRSLRARSTTLTVQKVVERAFELARRRGANRALLFIIDEVGQYVARSSEKIEDLRALVEEFGKVGRNLVRTRKAAAPAWVVVTSQEKLDEVVAALDARRVDVARLQDRFRQRIDLAPADIREVATRRVLAKKSEAEPGLRQLYRASQGQLNAACKLERSAFRSEVDEEDFVKFYPYLPHHIDLSISIMTGIRLQPGAVRQLGGSCRTIIKQAYEMLASPRTDLQHKPVGTLMTLDRLFELVEGSLSTEKQKDISDITARFRDDPEDPRTPVRVAKALCLLEFVRGLARTEENLAACLVERVGDPAPRAAVAAALGKLRDNQFVRNTEDGWKLQTAQEKNWDTERRSHLGPSPRQRTELLREALQALFEEPRYRTYRYQDLRTFKVGIALEDDSGADEGQVPLRVYLADTPEALADRVSAARAESRLPENENRVYWVAALTPAIDDVVNNLYASRTMINKYGQLKAGQRISPDEAACLKTEEHEENLLRRRLRELLADALEHGMGVFRGTSWEAAELGRRLPDILKGLFDECVPKLYPKLEWGARPMEGNEAEELLRTVDAHLGQLPEVFHQGEHGLNLVVPDGPRSVLNPETEACQEVLNYLKHEHGRGTRVTGKDLEARFLGMGYGWDRDVLRLFLAVLLRAGKVEVTYQGRRFRNRQDPLCREVFKGHAAFRAAGFAPWESLGMRALKAAVDRLEELTGAEVDFEESAIAARFKELAEGELKAVLPLEATLRAHRLTGPARQMSEYRQLVESILAAPADECVRSLVMEGRSVQNARDEARRLYRLVNGDSLAVIERARAAAEVMGPALVRAGIDLGGKATALAELLASPELFEHLNRVAELTRDIQDAYREVYERLHQRCAEAYLDALTEVRDHPSWSLLAPGQRDELLEPLAARSCRGLDLADGAACCAACGAALGKLESDLLALEGLKAHALARLAALVPPPEEKGRVERVKLARFFPSPLETEPAAEEALGRLREHLRKLLADGFTVIPE